MDLETEDAVAQRPGGGRRAARGSGLERDEACDLLQQESTKGCGQRQVVLLGLAEAGEHVPQDVGNLAGRQLELGKRTRRSLHWSWQRTGGPAECTAAGEAVGCVVDVAVETPEPFLGEQRLGEDVGLLVGAGVDRLDAVIEGLELESQGACGLRLLGAQDGTTDRAE